MTGLYKLCALLMYLKGTSDRDYLLAKFQLNTGLRISDVVSVKVCDVMSAKRRFKEHLVIDEVKTNKSKSIKKQKKKRKKKKIN